MRLTVLICTHNRSELLARVLASLNAAARPDDCEVELFVVANACTDDTLRILRRWEAEWPALGGLPLRWAVEPQAGKSNALNRAIPMIQSDVVTFVDDDHRVDTAFLMNIAEAARRYPEATMFCGRILPDWDGREPGWVHDTGPYRIYPLPVPRYDGGPHSREINAEATVPGGGNLSLRRGVFDRVGGFSAELGPHGHDLGGGEDSDFVHRCLNTGERIRYVPAIIQYHYVDPERLRFTYLLRKSFQRSRSGIRIRPADSRAVPLYIWRKIATYFVLGGLSFSWPRTRFYLVRVAAALGELRGFLDTNRAAALPLNRYISRFAGWVAPSSLLAGVVLLAISGTIDSSLKAAFLAALLCSTALILKSSYDFSQTGPPLKGEILRNYRAYSVFALLRVSCWAFLICLVMAWAGVVLYMATTLIGRFSFSFATAFFCGIGAVILLTLLQFCQHLLYLPGSIAASYHYRISRLYPFWRQLTPARIRTVRAIGTLGIAGVLVAAGSISLSDGRMLAGIGFMLLALVSPAVALAFSVAKYVAPVSGKASARPNILMIGSDTLRADRIRSSTYRRHLTPYIDSLARKGTQFTDCYVPCARTAPSLLSLFTGVWPSRHGIRDNFVGDGQTELSVAAIPRILAQNGYRTATVSDWCGGDLAKFPLGFQTTDVPSDQWNIKYLIRQGPKDLRLFLSLFTHNAFGKRFLPELYYLAGVPLTSLVGRDARAQVSRLASGPAPFFLNVFMSTTHPPFGSEYPYYTLWSDNNYAGESKFVMARLTDPWDIIRRQGDTKKDFDLEQIIDLYDGCVKNFDDEVKRIVEHVRACGLEENTIVVIYSDHGMEFFEHDTWGQGNSVRGDFSARIPMIIRDPRIKAQGQCASVVRSIDLAPTLLELAGLERPRDMDGVSLVPYMRDQSADMNLAAFNETGIWLTDLPGMPSGHLRYPNLLELLEVPDRRTGTLAIKPQYWKAIIGAKDRMVRLGRWKLVYQPTTDGPLYALYDLVSDPECRQDVAHAHPAIVRELRERLADWIADLQTSAVARAAKPIAAAAAS